MSLRTINGNVVELTGGDTTAAQPEAKMQKYGEDKQEAETATCLVGYP